MGVVQTFCDNYASTLASSYTSGATTLVVTSVGSGAKALPTTGNFYLIVDPGLGTEECFLVTSRSGTTLTVVGAKAGTSASNHSGGAVVKGPYLTADGMNNFRAETAGLFSSSRPKGSTSYSKGEYSTLAASGETTLLDYSGGEPGYVSLFQFFTTIGSLSYNAIDGLYVRVYIDGSGTADIDVKFKSFFCCEYGDGTATNFHSKYLGVHTNGLASGASWEFGGTFALPIPFTTGIKIVIYNSTATVGTNKCGWQISYHTGVPNIWPRTRRLKVASGSVTTIAPNAVTTMVDVSGLNPGRYMGGYFLVDGFGASTPAKVLEGNFKFYIDGGGSPQVEFPGTEDYPAMPFYFANRSAGGACMEWAGLTFLNSGNTWGFYRVHVLDPIDFTSAFKATWQCGDTSQVSYTGNAARFTYALWYYTE